MYSYETAVITGWIFLVIAIINLFFRYENKTQKFVVSITLSIPVLIFYLINIIFGV